MSSYWDEIWKHIPRIGAGTWRQSHPEDMSLQECTEVAGGLGLPWSVRWRLNVIRPVFKRLSDGNLCLGEVSCVEIFKWFLAKYSISYKKNIYPNTCKMQLSGTYTIYINKYIIIL